MPKSDPKTGQKLTKKSAKKCAKKCLKKCPKKCVKKCAKKCPKNVHISGPVKVRNSKNGRPYPKAIVVSPMESDSADEGFEKKSPSAGKGKSPTSENGQCG